MSNKWDFGQFKVEWSKAMTNTTQSTKNIAFDAVVDGYHIENNIRNIVVQALKEGKIQPEAIKQTLSDVLEGAFAGMETQSSKPADAIKQVIKGIDAALGQVAEASKLAIEEASANVQDFSDHDLKRALTDLEALEGLFFDTLSEVADKGQESTRKTLTDLVTHLQNSGSFVGESVKQILSVLHHDLARDGRLQQIQLSDVAKATGSSFARIASGILAGIADSLEPNKR